MRIHKTIEIILKATPAIEVLFGNIEHDFPPDEKADFRRWIMKIVNDLWEDPIFEQITQDYGLMPEEIGDVTEAQLVFFLQPPNWEDDISGWMTAQELRISVPYGLFKNNQPDEVADVLLHEVVHLLDEIRGTKGLPAVGIESWVYNEDEMEALQAEIEVLLNDGYTDDEVIGILLQMHADWMIGNRELKDAFIQQIETLIVLAREEGRVLT